jgi:hypothetical protein
LHFSHDWPRQETMHRAICSEDGDGKRKRERFPCVI